MKIEKYMQGECHVMACALHRNLETSFLMLCERSKDYRDPKTGRFVPSVFHVYAVFDRDVLIDIRGEHDSGNVKEQWLALGADRNSNRFLAIEISDERELASFVSDGWELPLTSYTDNDVAEAWTEFQRSHPLLLEKLLSKKARLSNSY